MISLDKAIKTRWTATGMSAVIPSGPYFQQLPEADVGTFPYCIYAHISDVQMWRTKATRGSDKQVQFQVYDVTPDAVGIACEAIKAQFLSSDRAATNPLSISNGGIVDVRLVGNYTITQESDGVYSATMVLGIQYTEDSGLTPA